MVKRVKLRRRSYNGRTAQDSVKRAELRCRAKFGRNRPNRCRDMSIFRFVEDVGRPPSWICYVCVRTNHEFGGLYHCAKFGWT